MTSIDFASIIKHPIIKATEYSIVHAGTLIKTQTPPVSAPGPVLAKASSSSSSSSSPSSSYSSSASSSTSLSSPTSPRPSLAPPPSMTTTSSSLPTTTTTTTTATTTSTTTTTTHGLLHSSTSAQRQCRPELAAVNSEPIYRPVVLKWCRFEDDFRDMLHAFSKIKDPAPNIAVFYGASREPPSSPPTFSSSLAPSATATARGRASLNRPHQLSTSPSSQLHHTVHSSSSPSTSPSAASAASSPASSPSQSQAHSLSNNSLSHSSPVPVSPPRRNRESMAHIIESSSPDAYTSHHSHGPRDWIVTKPSAQGTLREFLKAQQGGSLDWMDKIRLIRGIVSGLTHLHDHGVLHCNLHSDNVLVENGPTAVLTDFGQMTRSSRGRPLEPSTSVDSIQSFPSTWSAGRVMGGGTYEKMMIYTAPERIANPQSSPCTVESDIYSLGVIMLEIITGHRSMATQLLTAMQGSDKRWSTTMGTSIPPVLETLIRKICARDPAQRPALFVIRSQLKSFANTSFDLHVREPISKGTTGIQLNAKKATSVVSAPIVQYEHEHTNCDQPNGSIGTSITANGTGTGNDPVNVNINVSDASTPIDNHPHNNNRASMLAVAVTGSPASSASSLPGSLSGPVATGSATPTSSTATRASLSMSGIIATGLGLTVPSSGESSPKSPTELRKRTSFLRRALDLSLSNPPSGPKHTKKPVLIWEAVAKADIKAINAILAQGNVSVNQRDPLTDYTPLIAAVALPLDLTGASGTGTSQQQQHHHYSQHHQQSIIPVLELLINRGAEINACDSKSKQTILHHLCSRPQSSPAVLKFLLERGANPNAVSSNRQTPLHYLAEKSAMHPSPLEAMRLLLDFGADVNVRGPVMWTPLHLLSATESPHLDAMMLLLTRGVEVNAKDSNRWTPLHFVAHYNKDPAPALKMMFDAGASVNSLTKRGEGVIQILLKSPCRDKLSVEALTANTGAGSSGLLAAQAAAVAAAAAGAATTGGQIGLGLGSVPTTPLRPGFVVGGHSRQASEISVSSNGSMSFNNNLNNVTNYRNSVISIVNSSRTSGESFRSAGSSSYSPMSLAQQQLAEVILSPEDEAREENMKKLAELVRWLIVTCGVDMAMTMDESHPQYPHHLLQMPPTPTTSHNRRSSNGSLASSINGFVPGSISTSGTLGGGLADTTRTASQQHLFNNNALILAVKAGMRPVVSVLLETSLVMSELENLNLALLVANDMIQTLMSATTVTPVTNGAATASGVAVAGTTFSSGSSDGGTSLTLSPAILSAIDRVRGIESILTIWKESDQRQVLRDAVVARVGHLNSGIIASGSTLSNGGLAGIEGGNSPNPSRQSPGNLSHKLNQQQHLMHQHQPHQVPLTIEEEESGSDEMINDHDDNNGGEGSSSSTMLLGAGIRSVTM